jgi:hypothetical protein
MDRLHADGRGCHRRRGHRLAGDRTGQPAQQLDKAGAARVHDSRLAQDVELIRGAGDGLLAVPHEIQEQLAERLGVGGPALGLLRELADDGEHRPLDRPAHGAIGGVGGSPQRPRRERRVDPVRRLGEDVGDPADDLGEDDAGVAAGSHQRGEGNRVRERRPVARLGRADGVRDRPHGQREVGPGVAVGDGIDVEVVDAAAARLERRERRADQAADPLEIGLSVHFPPVRTSSTCTSTARTVSPVSRSTS